MNVRLLVILITVVWCNPDLCSQTIKTRDYGKLAAEGSHLYRMIESELSDLSTDRAAFARKASGVRETWSEYVDSQGVRTFVATRKGEAVGVERILHRVDRRGNPIFIQISRSYQGRKFEAKYRLEKDSLVGELKNDPSGESRVCFPISRPISFVSHPLCTDGLHFAFYDSTEGGKQTHSAFVVSTRDKRSLTGSVTNISCRYDSSEDITVPAGSFLGKRFTWWIGDNWSAEIWLDSHLISLRMKVPGMEMVLTKYRRAEK
jgi:hypothetical protein